MIHSQPRPTDLAESHWNAIQALAEHSHSPLGLVEEMYRSELIQVESEARIAQYVPLVTSRRVRNRLQRKR
jgi:hypothetical protein